MVAIRETLLCVGSWALVPLCFYDAQRNLQLIRNTRACSDVFGDVEMTYHG